jgi:hypothetical protein
MMTYIIMTVRLRDVLVAGVMAVCQCHRLVLHCCAMMQEQALYLTGLLATAGSC